MREAVLLHPGEQLRLGHVEPERVEPGPQKGARVLGAEVGADRARACIALAHHTLDDPQHDAWVGRLAAVAPAERPDRQGHRGVRPLGRAALGAAGARLTAPQPAQKLFRSRRGRRLGPGPPDVDPGVVVGTADAGAAVGLDVDGGRHVQLARAGAVAGLPHGEQPREPAAVARRKGRSDRVERMGQGTGDAVPVQVLGHLLHVSGVCLQPVVVGRRDAPAENVDRLRLAAEPRGELLGDEHLGPVGDLEDTRDRVVVGDRHEVHPAPAGEPVDLLRRGGALGKAERPLHAEPRLLRGRRVAVEVDPGDRRRDHLDELDSPATSAFSLPAGEPRVTAL